MRLQDQPYFKRFNDYLKEEVNENYDNVAVQLGSKISKDVLEVINEELYKDQATYEKIMASDDDTTYAFYEKVLEAILGEVATDIGNNDPRAGAAPDEIEAMKGSGEYY